MPKRFSDTGKLKKPWLRRAPFEYKLFWIYVLDFCDHSGFYDVDMDEAEFYTGCVYVEEEIIKFFDGRIIAVKDEKWLIRDFLKFQYGLPLNPSNKIHRGIIQKHKDYGYPLNGVIEGLPNPYGTPKEKDKEKDKEKEQVKAKAKVKENNNAKYDRWESKMLIAWNELADQLGLSKINKISLSRRRKLKVLYKDKDFMNFGNILTAIKEQPWLHGNNEQNWRVSIDWLIANDVNYIKVLERKYKNGSDDDRFKSIFCN